MVVKELPVDLKALDPTSSRVDPRVLLIAYGRERKGIVICTEVCPKGVTARVVAGKEGI
jgi:hypothetical protein